MNEYYPDFGKTTSIVYYGSFRPNRIEYFQKYFDERVTVSASPSNFQKFKDWGIEARFIGRLGWNDPKKSKVKEISLKHFLISLYIEDDHTHNHYNYLANRFYEAIKYNVCLLFDESCRGSVEKSGYPISDWHFINSKEDLHRKVDEIKLNGFNWPEKIITMCKVEKVKVLRSIYGDILKENKRILFIESHAAMIREESMGVNVHARNALEMVKYLRQILGEDNIFLTMGMEPWKYLPHPFDYYDIIVFNHSSYYQHFQKIVGHLGGWGGDYFYVLNEYNIADHPALRELYKIYGAKFSVIANFKKDAYKMTRDYFWNALDKWYTINLNALAVDYDVRTARRAKDIVSNKRERSVLNTDEARKSKEKIDIIMNKDLRRARGRRPGILV